MRNFIVALATLVTIGTGACGGPIDSIESTSSAIGSSYSINTGYSTATSGTVAAGTYQQATAGIACNNGWSDLNHYSPGSLFVAPTSDPNEVYFERHYDPNSASAYPITCGGWARRINWAGYG